jgi:hypothetical protein
MSRLTSLAALLFVPLLAWAAGGRPAVNVNLVVDYAAAEQTIALFEDQPVRTAELAQLRGNRIAAATAGYIADRSTLRLGDYLDSLKLHRAMTDDVYHLEEGRRNVGTTKALLLELKKRNFARRVVATVEQIFPADADLSVTIPVYIVALGHENVDAFVRRVVWRGDEPRFVGEREGELTIVINLSQSVNYGPDLEERFITLLGVVAHEVFHAAFGVYKETSRSWKEYSAWAARPFDLLLDITQNEGIAYYLSLDQRGGGYVPHDWDIRTRQAVATFNRNAGELLSPRVRPRRVEELIRTANLSGYWDSYGAMTGMFMAREIDTRLGRGALIETIARSPYDFFQKYLLLAREESNLPQFSPVVLSSIPAK